ncbi:MAG: 30S ribosomal protein S6--L-glutamate ligase [Cyanobacteria bacterium P01_F01_bin.13]
MKIAVLSRDASLYSTRRLLEAGNKRGHIIKIIDHMRCYIDITADSPRLIYQGAPVTDIDAVIPRIGASYTFYGTAVVRQFEMMGVLSANSSDAISRSRDKLRCLQLLSKEGVGLPVTGFAHSTKDTEGVIELVGGAPLVIKLLEGTQGIGVVLAETYQAAKSVIEAFRGLDANILVQEFIKEAKGQDLRCFVVNNRVVAAMKRQGAPGEFRSNIHRGGTVRWVKLSLQERDTAVRAANAMGLKVAGVDLLRADQGPVVIEVNSSPGLEGIERATDIDVASKIIQYLEQQWRMRQNVT